MQRPNRPLALLAAALILAAGLSACQPSAPGRSHPAGAAPYRPPNLRPVTIGNPPEDRPWIANVTCADLDRDGLLDVLVCDGKANTVNWIRQVERGRFEETVLADGIPAPVHTQAVDFDGDGDLDILVASMGVIFPNNDKIGSVVILENDGHQHFTKHVVLEHVARVCDVEAGDFNHDGKLDLAVAQFGYDQGECRWMENLGNWQFRSTILCDLPGGINVCVADYDGDGNLDIAALISQQYEEIFLYTGDGRGNFTSKVIFGSTNEDYGSSNLAVCDLNGDGRPDLLYTNGDGFDYATPGPRPWHGVQWLENRGGGMFQFHRIGDMAGAYGPTAMDLDNDGAMDVVVVSCFNVWERPDAYSLMLFHNDGHMRFTPHPLARFPTHLLTSCAGDFDGNGRSVLVTGGFHAYPPWDHVSRVSLWRPAAAP